MSKQLQISIGEHSTKGVKESNQDFHDIFIPKEPQLTTKGIALALADGISSSDVSHIASKSTVTSFLMDYFATPESWSVKKSAQRVLSAANSWLYSQSQQGKYFYDKDRGYICTLSAMIIRSNTAYTFHIGDSRICRLRDNSLEQLTEDHRIWISNEKSHLSRAMGVEAQLKMDYNSFEVLQDDIFIFMTDGIYEFISKSELINIIKENDLISAAKIITDTAFNNGSDDNLTVQIIHIDSLPNKELQELNSDLSQQELPPILEARMLFDGYKIIRELSGSSRSHVYLALDEERGIQVVLKTPSIDLKDDKKYLDRFMMEEWVAIRMNNAHLLKAYPQTRKRNFLYTVTEYIEGQTLTQWMIDNPKAELPTIREMVEQIAKGLQAMHRQEMLHQDLRPENIMIDKDGTLKIIDFGATRIEGILEINNFSEDEQMLGTLQYSAPEYFLGDIGTKKSDIFSLAVIVYQMLSATLPYSTHIARATTIKAQDALKYTSLYSEDEEKSLVPLWIDGALQKALSIDPYYRYEELSEFLYDLKHPNKDFLSTTRPPLYERNPLLLWKGISFVLAITVVVLLAQ